jgi:hypothetical protein
VASTKTASAKVAATKAASTEATTTAAAAGPCRLTKRNKSGAY